MIGVRARQCHSPPTTRQRLIFRLGFAALLLAGLIAPSPVRPATPARPVLDCRDFPRFAASSNSPHAVEVDPDPLHADRRSAPFALKGRAGLLIAAANVRRYLTLTPEPGAKIAIRVVSRGRTVTSPEFVIAPCPGRLGDRLGIVTLLSTRQQCVVVKVWGWGFTRTERIAVGPEHTPAERAFSCESP